MKDRLDTLDAHSIINQMHLGGWFFIISNCTVSDSGVFGGALFNPDKKFVCLFSKRKGARLTRLFAGVSDDFTEAVQEGARKALERGW